MLPTPTRPAFPAGSIKVALGIGNWAIGSYSLVITQANYCFVWYAQMPNAQCPIPNWQFPVPRATFIELAIYPGW